MQKKVLLYYNTNLSSTTFKILKNTFFKKSGLITNNFTKSLMFLMINRLLLVFFKARCGAVPTGINLRKASYVVPVQALTFTILKSKTKTILFFILNSLTTLFSAPTNTFVLNTTYLYFPVNFNTLTFVNLFYFKVRNF